MFNSIWFVDDKFLKFYSCSYKKRAKRSHLHVCGDCWLSYVWARQCTSTESLQDGWVFGSRDTWLQPPCCLVLTRWTSFHQQTRLSLLLKQG